MNKLLLTAVLLGSCYMGHSQVGVGTVAPQGAFEVVSTTDGMLIPRVALTNTSTATILTPTKSELVYNTATAGDVTPGYYYWETTPTVATDRWVRLASAAAGNDWAVTGNAGTNPATNFAGTTDAQDFAIRTNNTERARVTSAGSMGIGTTLPNGALDINSSTQGMVPPRVALTSTALAAPVTNPNGALVAGTLVWNTNTNAPTIATAVAPGMYYWNGTRWISLAGSPGGLDWSIIGNGGIDGGTVTAGGTHFLGTYDNTNMDIRTNGLHRARVSALGEFFIGAYNTVLPGDLMNGVSVGNALFPWAINGYTDQDGAGTYGMVQAGSTNFGGVQGEYYGTGARGAGVRGIFDGTTSGTGITAFNAGVTGDLGTTNRVFAFATAGRTMSNNTTTVGGAIGQNNNNGEYGILGYERSNGDNYAVLGSSTAYNGLVGGGPGTRISQDINSSIGFGFSSGFLGGHLKGNQYGLITKGDLVGQYTDGSSISNKGYAVVNTTSNGEKVATYVPTSTTVDVSTKGTGKLVNGTAKISFTKNYSNITDKNKPVIVTVSPMGETKGVYVSEVTSDGFTVKENGNGNSNVSFYWIAIGEKNNSEEMNIPADLLAKDFDANLDSFLNISEEAKETSKAMWWNGRNLEFGKTAPKEAHEGKNIPASIEKPKTKKKEETKK